MSARRALIGSAHPSDITPRAATAAFRACGSGLPRKVLHSSIRGGKVCFVGRCRASVSRQACAIDCGLGLIYRAKIHAAEKSAKVRVAPTQSRKGAQARRDGGDGGGGGSGGEEVGGEEAKKHVWVEIK